MVTGSEILNYTGNAALGLNNAGIENYGETDFKELNSTLFNLAYLNMQKNKEVWQQKLKERDDGMKLIGSGELQLNNALPKDREKLMEKIAAVKKIYFDNGGDVKTDPKVWLSLNEKLADFKTANTVAQSRLEERNKGLAEAAKETNPVKKKAMMQHWSEQEKNKDLYQPFDPYQQTLDYDTKITMPGVVTTSTSTRDGDYDVVHTITDLRKSYDDYIRTYMTNDKGETAPNVESHFDDFFGQNGLSSPESVTDRVGLINKTLKNIAIREGYDISGKYGPDYTGPLPDGLKPLPDYLKPIKITESPDGVIDVSDRKEVAMAKINLAANYKNEQAKSINPKYAAIDKTRSDIKNNDLKAGAYVETQKSIQFKNRMAGRLNQLKSKSVEEAGKEMDNIFYEMAANKEKRTIGGKDYGDIIFAGNLPDSYKDIASGVGADGKPLAIKPFKVSFDKNGKEISQADLSTAKVDHTIEFYKVKKSPYYVMPDGSRVSDSYIRQSYQSLTAAQKKQFGSLENYKKINIEERLSGKQEDVILGKNGEINPRTTLQAQRSLQNKSISNKFDEELYTPEDQEPPNQ